MIYITDNDVGSFGHGISEVNVFKAAGELHRNEKIVHVYDEES